MCRSRLQPVRGGRGFTVSGPRLFHGWLTVGIVAVATACTAANDSTDTVNSWTHLSSATGDLQAPNSGAEQTSCLILDVDRDNVNDFVVAERTAAPSVVWYRLESSGWEKYVVDAGTLRIEAGGTFHDIDGDNDLDIVFAGDSQSNEIWWWENPYPNYNLSTPWTRRLIKDTDGYKHHDQQFGDVDGDGKAELVTWNQGDAALLLIEIPADPKNHTGEWPRTTIATVASNYEGMAIADIDLDGKLNIAGAGRWYKHTGGTSFQENLIDGDRVFTRTAVGQLVPGGRPEVVIVPGDANGPLEWYEWNGSSWTSHELDDRVIHGHSLAIADFNEDGDLDIFVAEMGNPGAYQFCEMYVYYGDGAGQFNRQILSTGVANHESKVGDLDNDGDVDILGKPYNYGAPRLDVWLNDGGSSPPPPPPPPPGGLDDWYYIQVDDSRQKWGNFDPPVFLAYFGLGFGHINGDGKLDIVSGRYAYLNPGGDMTGSWTRRDFGINVDAVLMVNVDGDALADVIATAGSKIYWMEADDNNGTSWTPHLIDTTAPNDPHPNPQGYAIADIVAGGRPEIILSNDDVVYYYTIPSSSPEAGNWPRTQILDQSLGEGIGIGDIDRDGDLDIAAPHESNPYQMKWASNPGNGTGNWSEYLIGQASTLAPDRVAVADVNGDNRLDIICTEESTSNGASSYWFEAPLNPTQSNWTRHEIVEQYTTNSMDAADMDDDGDVDVILQEHRGTEKLAIWVNSGNGQLTEKVIDTGKEGHLGARVADLDGDGDLDIASICFDAYQYLHVWRNDNDGGGGTTITCYADNDGDGYGSTTVAGTSGTGTCPSGQSTNNNDCNDTQSSIHPDANDIPDDGIDQDCSGADRVTCYVDGDGDGYGTSSVASVSDSGSCPGGQAASDDDCNDGNGSIHPGATDTPNDGIDQDCSGFDQITCYVDGDNDGYGSDAVAGTSNTGSCSSGQSENSDDCKDNDPSVHPGATDTPDDGIDQDCDGADATSGGTFTCYVDGDGDGYGSNTVAGTSNTGSCPSGESPNQSDCDDTNGGIHPGATDTPDDGVDQDCDGADATSGGGTITCHLDADSDGYGASAVAGTSNTGTCPAGQIEDDSDCDDNNSAIHPGATDTPDDGIDQDCSGADATSGGGGSGGGGGGGAPDPSTDPTDDEEPDDSDDNVEDTISGDGTADAQGTYATVATNANGEPVAAVSIVGANPGDAFTYEVKPDNGTTGAFAGFAGDIALPRMLSVETTATPGSFIATLSLTFTADELAALGVTAADVRLHALDETNGDPPGTWVPAGANDVGESDPTGVVGDYGYVLTASGGATFWTVRNTLSAFAAGPPMSSPTNDDSERPDTSSDTDRGAPDDPTTEQDGDDGSTPPPAFCGSGAAVSMSLTLAALGLVRGRRRKR